MNISEAPLIAPCRLCKSAPSNKILQTVSDKLHLLSVSPTDIDIYADQLVQIVQAAIEEKVPLAKCKSRSTSKLLAGLLQKVGGILSVSEQTGIVQGRKSCAGAEIARR